MQGTAAISEIVKAKTSKASDECFEDIKREHKKIRASLDLHGFNLCNANKTLLIH